MRWRRAERAGVRAAALAALAVMVATSAAAQAPARWRLVEVARIGGDDEGLASFNDIRDLQIGADGTVWVLDYQTRTLRLFGADGAPLREVARRGQGPGEIANGNGFRRAPDGRMVLRDHSNRRFNVYAPDGRPLPSVMMSSGGYGYRWEAEFDAQGRLHELTAVRRGEEFTQAMLRWAPDLSRADTAWLPERCTDAPPPRPAIQGQRGFVGIPFEPRVTFTIDGEGAMWCASTDEYRVRRFRFGAATHDRELRLPNQPSIPIPASVRDSAIRATEEMLSRIGGAVEPWEPRSVRREAGPLQGFVSDERGRLWVLREMPGNRFEFDVWDGAGRRIAVLPVSTRRSFSPLMRVRGDRLALVTLDDDDIPVIVLYEIRQSP